MGKKNARILPHRHPHRLCCHRIIQLVMSLFLLNLSGFIQPRYLAEGKKNLYSSHKANHNHVGFNVRAVPAGLVHAHPKEEVRAAVEQSLIGSRPPSCDGSCRGCLRCVAVQVPVSPQTGSHSLSHNLAYARGNDISNYKPMTWKCKCGDFIFNP